MSEPPLELLGPQERVGDLVELLQKSGHNGFPVVENGTRRFLGLVRRAQIAALLECGVFSQHRNIKEEEELVAAAYGIQVGGNSNTKEPAPLMHWAYYINDDRYDHILSIPEEEVTPMESHKSSISMQQNPDEESDDLMSHDHAQSLLSKEQQDVNKSIRMSLMPSPSRRSSSSSWSLSEIPQDFCTVYRDDMGNVTVPWYNAEFRNYWVDLASVANRGTYTVSEFCPVSKAYKLFTALGLRHIVVLGGRTGGEVVGMLTRASFLDSHIEKTSGL
mmetsp:Transcript_24658/g.52305  ORF Transcript_24658/g.52305 Transcript_24658/m.52305 type:complete len:275 (-) Transcript_24658:582-1406(-)